MGIDSSNRTTDWREIEDLVEETYCLTAPKRLVQLLKKDTAAAITGRLGAPVILMCLSGGGYSNK
jgi:hypothetical protein